jgi:hypothetical protein
MRESQQSGCVPPLQYVVLSFDWTKEKVTRSDSYFLERPLFRSHTTKKKIPLVPLYSLFIPAYLYKDYIYSICLDAYRAIPILLLSLAVAEHGLPYSI